ncbi:PAS domain S-box protein, partial [Chloroflexota bacterium]
PNERYEAIAMKRDGTTIVCESNIKPIQYEGKPAFAVIVRDITERKQMEEKYRQLLEDMNDGYVVIQDGKYVFANGRFSEILGYEPEQVIGMSVFNAAMPDERQALRDSYERVLRGEESPAERLELAGISKDGTPFVSEFTNKVIQYEGKPAIGVIVRDITERKQVEEKYRQLLEDMNDGYGVIQEGRYVFINRRSAEIFGYEPEQILGKSIAEFMTPEYHNGAMKEYERVMRGEEAPLERYEGGMIRGDGIRIAIESSLRAIQYEGKPAFSVIFRDITERKQAEEALIQSERKYRELSEGISDVFVALDEDLSFIYWNKAAERVTGISSADVLGKHHEDLFSDDNDMEKAREVYLEVIRTKQPQQIVGKYQLGGEEVFEISVYPSGSGVSVFARDITAHRRAKKDLEQAAKEWRTTFDSISDMVFICDRDFNIVRINKTAASALNMKLEELIGQSCYEIFHGSTLPVPGCAHIETLQTKEPASDEFFEPHLGIHIEVTTSPIFNTEGEVIASVHIIRDITERKNIVEQLMLTDRLASVGQLASGIAHELNNPLTSVIGFSELLLKNDFPDDIKEDLEIIDREARRAANVVKGLLTFTRGKGNIKALMDINIIIQGVLQLRSYEQRTSDIEVDARFAPDLPRVIVNGAQMQQVFMNIVINAEQAMLEVHGRGRLEVTTAKAGDKVRVSISDDGPGISPENIKKIFTPFFTTKEVGKGTGLGLSICHGIATEHGGQIYAESEPGKGANFILELPIPAGGGESNEKL